MGNNLSNLNELTDLDKDSFKPLYVQLCDSLIEHIQSNNLKAGDILPSENQLLSRYSVSRNTIRLAIERLVKLNLAQKRRGKGTFVSPRGSRKFVRGLIGFEESLGEYGLTVTNVMLEKTETLDKIPWVINIGGFSPQKALYIKRLKVLNEEPVALEERYLPLLVAKRFKNADFMEHSIFDLLEKIPEFEINRVSYILRSSLLSTAESKILKKDVAKPALRRVGIYYDSLGHKIMLSRLTLVSDKLTVNYDFHKHENVWGLVS
jgi:GntR family transcriptional regulator